MKNCATDAAVRAIEDIFDRGAFTPAEVEDIFARLRYDLDNNFILYRARAEKEKDDEP